MLLVCSKNLFGQTNDTISLRGYADSLVVIDIATIREANIKLIERNYLKEITNQQDTIISNQNEIIDKYKEENLFIASQNLELQTKYNEVEELNKSLSKNLKYTKIGLYTVGGISIAAIIYGIIKSIN